MQRLLAGTADSRVISFGLGLPAVDFLPSAAVAQAAVEVLSTNGSSLQYGSQERSLKSAIVELMAARGVACSEDQVFVTSGAQQGIALVVRLFVRPGDVVGCDPLVYPGFRQAVAEYRPTLVDVHRPSGELGDEQGSLGLIYLIPVGHNPLGTTMSPEDRQRALAVSRSTGAPIVEDDAYGFLQYDDQPVLALRALSSTEVFYVGSFSKILGPALRTGWIIAPEAYIAPLSVLKESSDINTMTLSHRVVARLLENFSLRDHLVGTREAYRRRRDVMVAALDAYMAGKAKWTVPSAGFFVWLEFDDRLSTDELLSVAVERFSVAFVPSSDFAASPGLIASDGARLSFSCQTEEQVWEGVRSLSRAVEAIQSA